MSFRMHFSSFSVTTLCPLLLHHFCVTSLVLIARLIPLIVRLHMKIASWSCSFGLTWFKMPCAPANRFTIFFSTVNEISCEIVEALKNFGFFFGGARRGGFFKTFEKRLGAVICFHFRGMAGLMDGSLLLFFGLGLRKKGQCVVFGPVRFVEQNFSRRI